MENEKETTFKKITINTLWVISVPFYLIYSGIKEIILLIIKKMK